MSKKFFISAYLMPPRTDDAFKDLAESGIDNIYIDYTEKSDVREKALDFCDKYDINAIIMCCWGKADNPSYKRVCDVVNSHKSFIGVNGLDEPVLEDMDSVIKEINSFKKDYPDKIFFVNAVNSGVPHKFFATNENATYEDYTDKYVDVVNTMDYGKTVSMTIYPLLHDGNDNNFLHLKYLQSFEYLTDASRRTGGDTYFFVQTMPFRDTHRKPEERDIRFQTNVGLAFGAKGFQYFCYRTPDPNWEFSAVQYAMILKDGTKTDIYYAVKNVNAELKNLADEYLPLSYDRTCVYKSSLIKDHGESFDNYYSGHSDLPDEINYFYATGDVLMGVFKDGDKNAYYLVNYGEPSKNRRIYVEFSLAGVENLSVTVRGKTIKIRKTFGRFALSLSAGEGALLKIL